MSIHAKKEIIEYPPKENCRYYKGKECAVLTEMACKKRKCTFYRKRLDFLK